MCGRLCCSRYQLQSDLNNEKEMYYFVVVLKFFLASFKESAILA